MLNPEHQDVNAIHENPACPTLQDFACHHPLRHKAYRGRRGVQPHAGYSGWPTPDLLTRRQKSLTAVTSTALHSKSAAWAVSQVWASDNRSIGNRPFASVQSPNTVRKLHHSALNARAGSINVARRAGTYAATSATLNNNRDGDQCRRIDGANLEKHAPHQSRRAGGNESSRCTRRRSPMPPRDEAPCVADFAESPRGRFECRARASAG